jgi:hypothetical protein
MMGFLVFGLPMGTSSTRPPSSLRLVHLAGRTYLLYQARHYLAAGYYMLQSIIAQRLLPANE